MTSGKYKKTKEHCKNLSISLSGKSKSKQHIINSSKAHKGQEAWNKGLTKETDNRIKIQSEKQSKIMKGMYRGEKHPNWRGGLSYLPYCYKFNKILKENIRERDNYQCQMPGCLCIQLEHLILYGKSLTVHHIHYDKENCYPHLISLCISCSSKANFNRDYWEEHFMKILKERNLI